MKTENCLLVGNGLNCCLSDGRAWANLLKETADRLGVSYNQDIPMPQEFERIIYEYLEKCPSANKKDIYLTIKKDIAKDVCGVSLPIDAIHRRIKGIPLHAIITTNYDYQLEKVYNDSFLPPKVNAEKYVMEPTSFESKVHFYHAHGIASKPQTICLGYEHYMGIVQRLRDSINKNDNNVLANKHIKQVLYGEKDRTNEWGERFYTTNISMIGFGLSETESDFWWLLSHRAYLYYTDTLGLQSRIKNKIIYYDTIDTRTKETIEETAKQTVAHSRKDAKHRLLRNYLVEVRLFDLYDYGSYENAYNAMLDEISNEWRIR